MHVQNEFIDNHESKYKIINNINNCILMTDDTNELRYTVHYRVRAISEHVIRFQ